MGRIMHFGDLPFELLIPTSSNNTRDIAIKTVPSASKTEIKKVLESLYGFEVEKVRTLNMQGKKKFRGKTLVAKPNYKKAYVTLKNLSSIFPALYNTFDSVEDETKSMIK
ncbi:uncharacterized protein LOC133782001 [Humulus lupulus]|uniref:uncharacterized protein LOC133782001 n=1 Tax=Humulus lupulus TaxID=3486 RepID=UPI002B403A44|nr:uncharacterized protein LOC133782001 [Humulus lupulus]XP_062077122.1 uncharacterized protein LOC133782001 [Humulus lupulus]